MRRIAFTVALLMACASGAQQKAAEVSEVAAEAAIVFRGQVVAEMQAARAPDEIAETRVTFRVDDGVRGTTNGQMLTIRQWNAAADEYRLGESLVLFLHAPSTQLGLTSPVGGRAGHKRVDEVPREVLTALRAPAEEAGNSNSEVRNTVSDTRTRDSLPAQRLRTPKAQPRNARRVEVAE